MLASIQDGKHRSLAGLHRFRSPCNALLQVDIASRQAGIDMLPVDIHWMQADIAPVSVGIAPLQAGDHYVAECPGVGTVSQGRFLEEAVANLGEATELFLEEFPLPDVERSVLTTFEVAIGSAA